MAKNMQTKFFEQLQRHLDDKRDGELVVNQEWANSGRAFLQARESFHNYVHFSYNFQSDYATFRINDTRDVIINFFREADRLEELVIDLVGECPDPAWPVQEAD